VSVVTGSGNYVGPGYGAGMYAPSAPAAPVFQIDCEGISDLTLEIAKVSSVVDKAATEINDQVQDPVIVSALGSIFEAMRGIVAVQDKIVTKILSCPAPPSPAPVPPAQIVTNNNTGMVN
jgi:hypothetical protein